MENNSSLTTVDEPNTAYILYTIAEVIIAVTAIIGNGLVLAAIITYTRLQTITNYFVGSLAAADFLVGILGIPCTLVTFNGKPEDYTGCLLMNSVIIILTQISIFGLLAIAVERFIAIKSPYRYTDMCTATVCIGTIVTVWLMGIAVGLLPMLAWNMSDTYEDSCQFTAVISMDYMVYVNFFACVLTPLIIILTIYCYIFHVVQQHIKRIAAVQSVVHNPDTQQTTTFTKEAKAAKWFAVVLLLFTVCWLPIHIMNMVTLFNGRTCFPCVLAAIIFSHINSAMNPVLYAFANSKFKTAFKQMLKMEASRYEESQGFSVANDQPQTAGTVSVS